MKMIFWAFFVVLVVHLNIGCADGSTVAKVNLVLTVVDDEGKPVDEVKVSGGGWIPGKYRAALVDGITNKQGEFKTSFKSAVDFGFFFDKEGYYKSQMHYYLTAETVPKIEKGYWQPNPIKETVVLKRVKNPVPMYAKNVYKVKIPTLGKPLGYDLIAGDWAAPYGKGTVADFIINATGTVRDNLAKEVHMTVTFSNAKDGIQSFKSLPIHNGFPLGSAFWSSHEAPIDGYEPVYKYESILTPEAEGRKNPGQRMDQNFYFRAYRAGNQQPVIGIGNEDITSRLRIGHREHVFR